MLDPDALVRRRRELGLTQEALGALAGLTERTVRSGERGRPISAASARAFAAALGVPLQALRWRSPDELSRRLAAAGCAPSPPPSPWAPRRRESERLITAFEGAERGLVAVISGPPGIGKTALARYVAAALRGRFPGGVAWVHGARSELEQVPLSQLRVAAALDFGARLPPAEIIGPDAFAQAFRTNLWTARRLVVLDDVARVSDVVAFATPEDEAWVLVTTMHRSVAEMPADLVVEVGPLDDDVSLELLTAHVGAARVEAERDDSTRLVELLGGVPRSLHIAGRVLERERFTRIGEYVDRLERSPAEPVDPLRDAATPADTSFTSAFVQLARSLSPAAWRFFGALSAFGGRPFRATWAAAVGAVDEADARRYLGELVEFFLVTAGEEGPQPNFTLDAQSQRVARWVAGDAAHVADERLLERASARAAELARLPSAEAVASFAQNAGAWSFAIELAVRAVCPGPITIVDHPDAVHPLADVEPRSADRLCRLLTDLRRPLQLLMPPGAARWLSVGLAAARTVEDGRAFGHQCRLMARWTGMSAPDVPMMTAWLHAAVPPLLAAGDVDEAIDAMAFSGKMIATAVGMRSGLPMVADALAAAERHGASATTRASLINTTACMGRVAVPGAPIDGAEAELRRALDLELAGPASAVLRSVMRLNAASLARMARPDGPRVDLRAEVATLRAALPDDLLTDFILDAVERFAAGEGGVEPVDDRTRRLVWLGVPEELVVRRFIMVLQLAMELSQYLAPPEGDGAPVITHPVGITPIFVAHALEVEMSLPGLLYPVAPLVDLLSAGGAGYLAAFGRQAIGADNPRYALLEHLVQRFAPTH